VVPNTLVELNDGDLVILGATDATEKNCVRVSKCGAKAKDSAAVDEDDETASEESREFEFGTSDFKEKEQATKKIIQVNSKQLVWTCSKISPHEKETMNRIAKIIGAKLSNSWSDDCTHMIANSLVKTPKVFMALLNDVPVVSTRWVEELEYNWIMKREDQSVDDIIPDPLDFVPESSKELTFEVELDYSKASRKNIFKDLKFLFFDFGQYQNLQSYVSKGGGSAIRFELATLTSAEMQNFFSLPTNIIIYPSNESIRLELQKKLASSRASYVKKFPWKKVFNRDIDEKGFFYSILNPLLHPLQIPEEISSQTPKSEESQQSSQSNEAWKSKFSQASTLPVKMEPSPYQQVFSQKSKESLDNASASPEESSDIIRIAPLVIKPEKCDPQSFDEYSSTHAVKNFKKFKRKTDISKKSDPIVTFIPKFDEEMPVKPPSRNSLSKEEDENESPENLDRLLDIGNISNPLPVRRRKRANILNPLSDDE
jgi:hypothetical protein